MGSVYAQGFPKDNTQAPSLGCVSQNTQYHTWAQHGVQSIPMQTKAAGLHQAGDERRVCIIFLLCWKLCMIGKCQSCFWLRIAIDVWREECGIAKMKGHETYHCLMLVRGLRSFVVSP